MSQDLRDPVADLGDNNPPSPMTMMELVAAKAAPLLEDASKLSGKAIPIVTSAADLEIIAAEVKAAKAMFTNVDGLRKDLKAPFDSMAADVQNMFMPTIKAVEGYRAGLVQAATAWQRDEQDRARKAAALAAETLRLEQERRAQSAAALADQGYHAAAEGIAQASADVGAQASKLESQASGSGADLVRAHTESGTISSTAKMVATVTDWTAARKVLLHKSIRDHMKAADLEVAIRAYMNAEIKAGREPMIPGVIFNRESKATFR